jgi:hypothetical protein
MLLSAQLLTNITSRDSGLVCPTFSAAGGQHPFSGALKRCAVLPHLQKRLQVAA